MVTDKRRKDLIEAATAIGEEKGRCRRRKIGCVITDKNGRIIGEGYNGTPLALPSCFDSPCPGADVPAGHGPIVECYGVHSEMRALLNVKDKSQIHAMYSYKEPCLTCTLALMETPCQEIVFVKKSNIQTGAELWKSIGRKTVWLGDTITNRVDSITDIIPKYQKTILPPPPSVKIELTSRCNFSCGFCAHRLREWASNRRDMEKGFFRRLIAELYNIGVKEIGLFYIGESLLCNWLPEAVKLCKDTGFEYVFLTTNGSLLTEDRAKQIMSAGLDSLKFSYNNADGVQLRAMTGMSPNTFEVIQANIQTAWKVREKKDYKTKLYASSIMYDGEQQKKMEAAVKKILPFVDQHYWLPLYSFGSQATTTELQMGYVPTPGNQGRIGALRPPLPCWAVFKEGHVTVEGNLSACCFDIGDGWNMGNLKTMSFMDAWNSEKFRKLRQAHLDKNVIGTACEDCAMART